MPGLVRCPSRATTGCESLVIADGRICRQCRASGLRDDVEPGRITTGRQYFANLTRSRPHPGTPRGYVQRLQLNNPRHGAMTFLPPSVRRPQMSPRPTYGRDHRRRRAAWASKVAAGGVDCARCGLPIEPGSPWDLGHVDGSPHKYSGPEHVACSRATLTHARDVAAAGPASVVTRWPDWPLEDPEPDNRVSAWSRHWAGPANPRCPDCRALGGPCDKASRQAA
jgi:hypothetical protein